MSAKAKHVFFYDHEITASNPLSLACFSQWFPRSFTDPRYPSAHFLTAEHYMMHGKALLFDPPAAQAILDAPTPAEAKALGRKIRNFDRKRWDEFADDIVERGNYLKFEEDEELKGYVVTTKGKILVEASETDRIWGIGFSAKDALGKEDRWGANRSVLPGSCILWMKAESDSAWDWLLHELGINSSLRVGGSFDVDRLNGYIWTMP
jgi:ribA/ribD-fused uncharacterized protein